MVVDKKRRISGKLKEEEAKKKELEFKPVICPRCRTENSGAVDSCVTCWLPLSKKAISKFEAVETVMAKTDIMNISREDLKNTIKEMIKSGEIKVS